MPLRSTVRSSPEHSSKDFVEHLRTVHFALLTVSVGLILLLTQRSYDARKASADINKILTVKNDIVIGHSTPHIDPKLVSDALKKDRPREAGFFEFAGNASSFVATPDAVAIHADPTLQIKRFSSIWRTLTQRSATISTLITWRDFPVQSGRSKPGGIRFACTPIHLKSTTWIRFHLSALIKTTSHKTLGGLWITSVRGVPKESGVQLRLGGPCFIRGEDQTDAISIEGSNEKYEFSFTVTVGRSVFDDRLVSTGKQPPIPRPFVEEFKDLAFAAQGHEDEPLELLAAQLTDEALKSTEAFEAFGFKFKGEQVTRWGIILLIGVQLYLVMYLKQLSGKLKPDDPGWDLPWMAMDQSLLARVMLFVSMVLLPNVCGSCHHSSDGEGNGRILDLARLCRLSKS